jgi:hypothetical protein
MKCRQCEHHKFNKFNGGAVNHNWCLKAQNKAAINGGRIISTKDMEVRPSWCPLVEVLPKEGK